MENDDHTQSNDDAGESWAGIDKYPGRLLEDGRERGLSKADRRYLASGGETVTADSENAHVNTRHRIRSRVRESIVDFWLLTEFLSDHDRDLIFSPDDEEWDKWEFEVGMKSAIEFFYEGLRDSDLANFETILASAIHDAERKHRDAPVTVDVDFDVTVQEQYQVEEIYDRFREGYPLGSREIGLLLTSGYVNDEETVLRLAEHARSNGKVANSVPPLLGEQLSDIQGADRPVDAFYHTLAHIDDAEREGEAGDPMAGSDYFYLEDYYQFEEAGHQEVSDEELLDDDFAAELADADSNSGSGDDGSDDTAGSDGDGAETDDGPDASR